MYNNEVTICYIHINRITVPAVICYVPFIYSSTHHITIAINLPHWIYIVRWCYYTLFKFRIHYNLCAFRKDIFISQLIIKILQIIKFVKVQKRKMLNNNIQLTQLLGHKYNTTKILKMLTPIKRKERKCSFPISQRVSAYTKPLIKPY